MRTMILALAVVLLAVPAMADVAIELVALDATTVEVRYDATGETELVRAFALDITATDGNIVDVNDFAVGDDNGGFGIFPGNFSRFITVNATTGAVDSWDIAGYTPVADAADPGAAGGLGSSAITIEMGALYDTLAPGTTGVLCTVTVTEGTTQVCATGNALRGNVVLEDAAEATLDLTDACAPLAVECLPSTRADYAMWVTLGKPDCWCTPYQCEGDADTVTSGFPFNFRVFSGDLAILVANWRKKAAELDDTGKCADIDRADSGFPFKFQIFSGDLAILVTNWRKKDADLTGNCVDP